MISGPVIPQFEQPDCPANERLCWGWVAQNWPMLWGHLVEHVYITAIAVGIGLVIAVSAALLTFRYRRLETPFVVVATILYTIPVLGFFLIMVSITGIGLLTIEIALVGYTLLLLYRNTLTGLLSVPPEVQAAAVGMGLTPRQILFRINVPLAIPTMMAGIRVATVTVISLATLAAFVSPLGLGRPILLAIGTQFTSGLVAGGALAIILALVADGLLLLATRAVTPWIQARR